jgi:hypothetical protein
VILFRSLQYSAQQVSPQEFLASYPFPALLVYDPDATDGDLETERLDGTSTFSRKKAAEWLSKTEGADWLSKTYEDVPNVCLNSHMPEEVAWVRKSAVTDNPFANLVTLGRLKTNDVVINSSVVSKVHAAVLVNPPERDGSLTYGICDQNSKNGTAINGTRLKGRERLPLKDLDWILLGSQRLRFVLPSTLHRALLDPDVLL